MPEGTVCSAQLTPPLPTNSSRMPGLGTQHRVEKQAHDQVAESRQDQRWKRFDPDADRQIGRAPDHVDGSKSHQHQSRRAGGSVRQGRGSPQGLLRL